MRVAILAIVLTACAAPATREVTVLVSGNPAPMVLNDGRGNCAIVLPRDVSYSALGAAVRECFNTEGRR